jgi:hypothetical protein
MPLSRFPIAAFLGVHVPSSLCEFIPGYGLPQFFTECASSDVIADEQKYSGGEKCNVHDQQQKEIQLNGRNGFLETDALKRKTGDAGKIPGSKLNGHPGTGVVRV